MEIIEEIIETVRGFAPPESRARVGLGDPSVWRRTLTLTERKVAD